MSPELLDAYLKVMRANGVSAGAMEIPWTFVGQNGAFGEFVMPLKMSFQFEPTLPEVDAAPGGWKAPLDAGPVVQNDLNTHGLDDSQLPEVE